MKGILSLAIPLALALAQTPSASPPPTSTPEERRVEWKEVAQVLEEERGTIWGYIPYFLQRPLAEALRRRVELGRPTVLLFPLEDLEDPDSYSAYFFYSQIFRSNLKARLIRLTGPQKGGEAVLLTGKQRVFLIDRELGVKEADRPERFFLWWRAAWERTEKVDPVEHARRAFMRGVDRVFR